jgi:hypothetical protein
VEEKKKDNAETQRTLKFAEKKEGRQTGMSVPQNDFADIGVHGRERAARTGVAVF